MELYDMDQSLLVLAGYFKWNDNKNYITILNEFRQKHPELKLDFKEEIVLDENNRKQLAATVNNVKYMSPVCKRKKDARDELSLLILEAVLADTLPKFYKELEQSDPILLLQNICQQWSLGAPSYTFKPVDCGNQANNSWIASVRLANWECESLSTGFARKKDAKKHAAALMIHELCLICLK